MTEDEKGGGHCMSGQRRRILHGWTLLRKWTNTNWLCELATLPIGSRPSDHYFRSVCLSVCLFVQSFSQPSLIRFRSN